MHNNILEKTKYFYGAFLFFFSFFFFFNCSFMIMGCTVIWYNSPLRGIRGKKRPYPISGFFFFQYHFVSSIFVLVLCIFVGDVRY